MDQDTHISVPDDVDEPLDGRSSEPMTPSQRSRLKQLSAEAGLPADMNLNRIDAAKRISELEGKMGRGGSADG